ncbi:MAG TPA: dihydrofolate reductase family protein [Opitutaceae bacterium]|jgi:dihydrofolate reductase|nr:dihydrofolate reductase family protein [Opitutaceae bacterium]
MHVTLLTAQSLDGFITRHDEPGSGFASPEDQTHFHAALADFDCCVMGSVTYRGAHDLVSANLAKKRLRVVLTRTPADHAAETRPGSLEFSSDPPKKLLADLSARGYARCVLLGGAQVHGLFFSAGLVDEVWLTIEPVLFGGGTPLLAARVDVRLELLASKKLNAAGTLLLRYRVVR